MKHLCREYRDKRGVAECGAAGLGDRHVTFRACDVTCPKCMKTKGFAKAAKHPFYGIKKKEKTVLEPWEEEMFQNG